MSNHPSSRPVSHPKSGENRGQQNPTPNKFVKSPPPPPKKD